MLQKAWSFAKRHKKKLIFATVFGGGAYCAWKFWLPRLQQKLLERLLQDSGDLKELLELARGADGEQNEKKARFAHKQGVSDSYVRKALAVLQERHRGCFAVEECSDEAKKATTREAKIQCLMELVIECIARLVSALYALHALLLLHRVEFNIVGREIAAIPANGEVAFAEAEGGHAAFLDTIRYFMQKGIEQLADAIRGAVQKCFEKAEFAPSTQVTGEVLHQLFANICAEVDAVLFTAGAQCVTFLLPESLDQAMDEAHGVKVKNYLDEARDYLESPQFAGVFRAVVSSATWRLAAAFGDGALDPEAAPLAGGRSCPLAKLNGLAIELSKSLLSEDNNDFITSFAEEPSVSQFCEAVYFNEAGGLQH